MKKVENGEISKDNIDDSSSFRFRLRFSHDAVHIRNLIIFRQWFSHMLMHNLI